MRKNISWIIGFIVIVGIGTSCTNKKESSSLQAREQVLSSTMDEELWGMSYFSLSPDGAWLFYPKSRFPENAKYALYDITNSKQYNIAVDEKTLELAKSFRIRIRTHGCWSADRNRVYIVGKTPYDPYFFVDIDRNLTTFSLRYDEEVSPEEKRFYVRCRESTQPVGIFTIQKPSKRKSVLIEKKTNRVLASHTPNSFIHNQTDIRDLSLSPNQRYLAYGVAESLGSFITMNDLYIVDLKSDQKPIFLSNWMSGRFVWSPDSKYVYGWIAEHQKTNGILRWSMEKLFPNDK